MTLIDNLATAVVSGFVGVLIAVALLLSVGAVIGWVRRRRFVRSLAPPPGGFWMPTCAERNPDDGTACEHPPHGAFPHSWEPDPDLTFLLRESSHDPRGYDRKPGPR